MLKLEHLINDLTDWIDTNIQRDIRVSDVAKKSGYSKWHLHRVFFQVKNINIADYIKSKKLEHAAKDLVCSNESIISICLKYSFESQQSFTRSFSQKYHISPLRYRRLHLESTCRQDDNKT